MRKFLAISLLLVHVFNMGGYQLLFNYFEKEQGLRFIQQLDSQQYNEADLVEVKVPVLVPYHNNWSDFERYDGEITIEGVHYNYVKRKVQNDTLILLCLPNQEKMQMQTARDQFFSLVNDLQNNDHNNNGKGSVPKPAVAKNVITEYGQPEETYGFVTPSFNHGLRIVSNNNTLFPGLHFTPEQPPESLS
ncbi:MAG: hypothetical protein SFU87_02390 [Chitinophagaceae bacterium]|nr:hypothetical protein [Chitinophagaceae bacterium]